MELTILGSGTCVPDVKRASPGYLLNHNNTALLVDCGPGALRQIVLSGADYKGIDAVLITHLHPDHISDLPALLHALVATPNFMRKKPLYLFGPEKLLWFYEDVILRLLRKPEGFEAIIRTCPLKEHLFGLDISSLKTIHSSDSFAYRIQDARVSVVITGDADYSEELKEFSRGADLLVADCSYPDGLKKQGHMTPSECARMAREAGVKSLVLSHLYPSEASASDLLSQCRRHFSGTVMVAEDLMKLEL